MKIDVVMCTKNSERLLEECLTSIYEEIPVCHLIVIDGFSTDRTLEIVDRFERNYGNIKIVKTQARLGKAREIGIKNVDTGWFAFIDSDVILRKEWFKKYFNHIREEDTQIGAVEGNFIHHYPKSTPKFPQFNHVVSGKRVDPRGLTIATLIKKEAVEDINIPDDLLIYEDEFIRRWIEKKGFAWIKVVDPVVDHFPTPNPWRHAYLMGIYSIRYNLSDSPAWRIILVSCLFPLKFVYFLFRTRSFIRSLNSVILSFYMLRGLIEEVLGISKDKKSW
jgi:glycosyltransferase involved in cell wall biosynthesis